MGYVILITGGRGKHFKYKKLKTPLYQALPKSPVLNLDTDQSCLGERKVSDTFIEKSLRPSFIQKLEKFSYATKGRKA